MTLNSTEVEKLGRWYRKRVRPFLEEMTPERIGELDGELSRLEKQRKLLSKPLSVCFVGGSGVGKSTLVNTLVSEKQVVVPSGGIGPLTAQALTIKYGEEPAFTAIYHAPVKIWRLIFAIEQIFKQELKPLSNLDVSQDIASALDVDDLKEIDEIETGEDIAKNQRADQYRKVSQLMICGHQGAHSEIAYLADSLRESIGKERCWGTKLRTEDAQRLSRLKHIFSTNEVDVESCHEVSGSASDFYEQLNQHASGFLAPAIEQLEVTWNSSLLEEGLELVDLPGVGIAGDVYRSITDKWVRETAQAIVLTVDNRGVRESDADLLRSSGFLTRMLHSADDPTADPVSLIIAVVKTDDIAESRRAQDREGKKKREHFAEVLVESKELVRGQIRERIEEAWSLNGGKLGETKQEVLDSLLETLEIYPLSALQYRKLHCNDEDDLPFIKDPAESGVPSMIAGLSHLAQNHRRDIETRCSEAFILFNERLTSSLELIRAKWEEGSRAREEAEELRGQLTTFLQPLRENFRLRQGEFRAFLKEVLPGRIESLISEARVQASKDIKAYLRTLRNVHWATLKAAVKRGGTFDGSRQIDLPRDFSQTYEEPIAEIWSKKVLSEVRRRTKLYADDCIGLVDEVVSWARDQGGRVQTKVLEAQRDAIRSDAKQLTSVGREIVNELRSRVKEKLIKEIEGPIRKRCQAFVNRNEHIGRGVKDRILDLFDELADVATEAAAPPAHTVLIENYQVVELEIRKVFENYQDPLGAAASAIVCSHEDFVKRSDAQKRNRVIQNIEAIFADQQSEEEESMLVGDVKI